MTDRLSRSALSRVPASARPRIDPADVGVGIVHLGVGAFHRAHQAAFTEDAIAARGGDWAICGVSPRSRTMYDQLAPQDGLYTVLVRDDAASEARVCAAISTMLAGPEQPDEVASRIADPRIHVVSLTVTEKGYCVDPATGLLRRDDPAVQADLTGAAPRTALGLLVGGLRKRMGADAGPLSVLCCDNLTQGGRTLAGVVREFVDLSGDAALGDWIETNASFPNSMVDRIVPATTEQDRADVTATIGLRDEAAVVTEPFRQWVVEDRFAGPRPAWEAAGALLAEDVTPFEELKLRMVNGAHSTLAYLGALAGCETVADTMRQDAFAVLVDRLMTDDARPTLTMPADFDITAYQRAVLSRFANAALRHRTVQIAMDGSQKLPQRLLQTIRARRAAGTLPRWAIFAVAGWMRWVSTPVDDDGRPRELNDPLAETLGSAIAGWRSYPDLVDRFLSVGAVFGTDLADDTEVRELLADDLRLLAERGALSATRELLGSGT